MTTKTNYPSSHIGITVPNIKEAVKFYSEVMGTLLWNHPQSKKRKETAIGQMCIDVFGEDWEEFEIAHLATSDGIGIELFSFPHGVKEAPEFNPFNTGLFHFVYKIQTSKTSSQIVSYGGKQRMPIREYYPNDKPFKMCRRGSLRNCFRNIHTQL
jgi:hypothetical protein